jgi:hypothetical protein
MWSLHNPVPFNSRSFQQNPELSLNGVGLGWFVADYRGEFMVRHGGAYDGMFSHTVMIPRKKMAVVVLSNSMTPLPQSLAYYTIDALLEKPGKDWSGERLASAKQERALKKKSGNEKTKGTEGKPSLPLEAYAGTYGGMMYGDATVKFDDGKLILQIHPNPDLKGELVHLQHDVFEIQWAKKFAWFGAGKVQFLLNQESEVTEFRMDVPNDDFWFDELEFKKKSKP